MSEMLLNSVIPTSAVLSETRPSVGYPVEAGAFNQLLGQLINHLGLTEPALNPFGSAPIQLSTKENLFPELPKELMQQLKLILPVLPGVHLEAQTGSGKNKASILSEQAETSETLEIVESKPLEPLAGEALEIPFSGLGTALEYLMSQLQPDQKLFSPDRPLVEVDEPNTAIPMITTLAVTAPGAAEVSLAPSPIEVPVTSVSNGLPEQASYEVFQNDLKALLEVVEDTALSETEKSLVFNQSKPVTAPVSQNSGAEVTPVLQSKQQPSPAFPGVEVQARADSEGLMIAAGTMPLQSWVAKNRVSNTIQSQRLFGGPEKISKHQLTQVPIIQPVLAVKPFTESVFQPEPEVGIRLFDTALSELELGVAPELMTSFAQEAVPGETNLTEASVDNLSFASVLTREVEQPVTSSPEIKRAGDDLPVSKEAIFGQIVEKAKVMTGSGHSEMELDLKPDHLGKIQLRVSLENHLISAKFVAESEQVKAIIETNLVDLKRMLQENGVQVQNLVVTTGQSANDHSLNQNPFSHHRQGQPQGNGKWIGVADELEMVGGESRTMSESVIDLIA